jgi:hypothetical protein
MAKKSKAFSELQQLHKRKPQDTQNPLASFEKKLRKESLPFGELVVSPPGYAKMSEVLEDFIEPYQELAQTKEATLKLLTLATIAWNVALLPKPERQGMIDKMITDALVGGDKKLKAEIQDLIKKLIARKNRYFSEYKRMILDFELKDVGSGYHLSVASTLSPESSPSELEFKVGDSVIVKQGVLDPDLGTDIGGWQGRIAEIEGQIIGLDWDSITLKNIPDSVIDQCEVEGYDWTRMHLEATEVELTRPRDTEEDVAAITEQIESQHRWSYLGEEGKGVQAVLADVDPDDEMAAFETWNEHLKKVLSFPFEAVVDEFQESGPLRAGDKVTVESLADVVDMYGILVKVKHKRSQYDFPLCDLEATEPNSSNYRFLIPFLYEVALNISVSIQVLAP